MSEREIPTAQDAVEKISAKIFPTQQEPVKRVIAPTDAQSYVLGEVPQANRLDPQAFLPLNSEKLIGSINVIEQLASEIGTLVQEEANSVAKIQRQVAQWEERIEQNKTLQQKYSAQVKHNLVEIAYDKKNRDFWIGRSEQVLVDYQHAAAVDRYADWSWLIKKYGLKNADGTEIDAKVECVAELCNGAVSSLSSEYMAASAKYESAKKEKEQQNIALMSESGKLFKTNEQLQAYVGNLYKTEVEPLQDGILLLKELGVKLRSLSANNLGTFGDLRAWAEGFLDEFLKVNPAVPQRMVTEFRRLASIPLPAQNS